MAKKIDKSQVRVGIRKSTVDKIEQARKNYEANTGSPITKTLMIDKLVDIGMSTWDMTKEPVKDAKK